ncbi:MAG: molecular chaperone DnaK [Candidatus Obscuribacterales bacterium]|nr:molecular chaperone DnaK [Candidatus Obscuribacterales bacterium]
MAEKIIGIDLGTTNSCVAVVEQGRAVVIPNSEGYNTTPSVVAFTKDGEKLVGQLAKRQAVMNPERTIQSIKRHMGSKYKVEMDHRTFSPEQISAHVLQKLKKQAQDYLGQRVEKAIITVPAYFDDAQRLATRDAGQIAGLDVVRIVNEPTACALTYGMHKVNTSSKVVVFDFGGGTFDVTILEISEGVLHVKSTNGNNQLGGDDFDRIIGKWIEERLKFQLHYDPETNPVALQRIKEAAEAAKIELSSRSSTNIQLPFLATGADGSPINFEAELKIDEFEKLTKNLVESARTPVEKALADAKLTFSDINSIILAGGTTRIPQVQRLIRDMFNQDPVRAVNPDEAVAMGAAVQGGILTGELDEILLLDVIPMSLGIEKPDGKVVNLFKRNTVIPFNKKVILTNNSDRQTAIRGHLVQGESEEAWENKSIARFSIPLPDLAPAKSLQFEVNFSIDVDGIFFCDVLDKDGNKATVELIRTNGLSREELEKLANEAQAEADTERVAVERNHASAQAQVVLTNTEELLSKNGDETLQAEKEAVRQAINQLRNAVLESDTADITRKTHDLEGIVAQYLKSSAGKNGVSV